MLTDLAFDVSNPDFQAELGYVPCRDDACELIACHPIHEGPYRVELSCYDTVFSPTNQKKEQRRLREIQAALGLHEEAIAALESAGVVPRHVHTTEAGDIVQVEWGCIHCEGKGWKVSPMIPCQLCTGRGTMLLNHTQMFLLLVREGLL